MIPPARLASVAMAAVVVAGIVFYHVPDSEFVHKLSSVITVLSPFAAALVAITVYFMQRRPEVFRQAEFSKI